MDFRIPFRTGIAAGLLWLAGCDSGPGPADLNARPPVVSELSYTPRVVDLNTAGAPPVEEGVVTVPLTVGVNATDPEGEVTEVQFVVESPYAGRAPVVTASLEPTGEGRFEGTAELEIPTAEVGRYAVVVYAVDGEGRLSNQVRGALELRNTGSPPVVASTQATRGQDGLRVVAAVTDPDGAANVAQVEARSDLGTLLILRDDGDDFASGDEEAGDGRFSGRIRPAEGVPVPQRFSVQALDRSGLRSDTVMAEVPAP